MKQFFSSLFIVILVFSSAFAQNGLHFDGVNDYVQTSLSGPTGSSDRTVECWIKTSASQSTQQVIYDQGSMSPLGSRFTLNLINFGKLRIEVGGNGFNSTQSIADGAWHHVAVTYDNSASVKFRMYIDGQLEVTQNTTVGVNTAIGSISIGRRVDAANNFEGVIDELRVWNTVRTLAQINATMNSEFCTIPISLVAYYKFNHGIAGGSNNGVSTVTDFSGSNGNGTLQNFSLSGSTSNWVTGATLSSGNVTGGTSQVTSCVPYTSAGGVVLNGSAVIQDTVTSAAGCDSVYTLDFTALQSSTSSLVVTECSFYTSPSGDVYFNSAIFNDTLQNAVGCDSIITIDLTVNNPSFSTVSPVVCSVYVSPGGQVITQSGTYADTIQNSMGCDSLFVMNVTVVGVFQKTVTDTACGSYPLPGGTMATNSGTYIDTLQSSQGCDSVITSNITINELFQTTDVVNNCGAYTSPNGTQYTGSGSYTENYTSTAGCDSVVTLELTVDALDATVNQNGFTLTAMSGYDSYQWIDCNNGNAPIAGESTNSFTASLSGNYAVAMVNGTCTDTSLCTLVSGVGFEELTKKEITLWPNPVSGGVVHVVSDNPIKSLDVVSANGSSFQFPVQNGLLDVSRLSGGVYFIHSPELNGYKTKLVLVK